MAPTQSVLVCKDIRQMFLKQIRAAENQNTPTGDVQEQRESSLHPSRQSARPSARSEDQSWVIEDSEDDYNGESDESEDEDEETNDNDLVDGEPEVVPMSQVGGLGEDKVREKYTRDYGLTEEEIEEIMKVRRNVGPRWDPTRRHDDRLIAILTKAIERIIKKGTFSQHARFMLEISSPDKWARSCAEFITSKMAALITQEQCPTLDDFLKQDPVSSPHFGDYLCVVMEPGSTTEGSLYAGSATGRIGLVGRVEARNAEAIKFTEPSSQLAQLLWDGREKKVVWITALVIPGSQTTSDPMLRIHFEFIALLVEQILHDIFGSWRGYRRNMDSLWPGRAWWKGLNQMPPLCTGIKHLPLSFKKMTKKSSWQDSEGRKRRNAMRRNAMPPEMLLEYKALLAAQNKRWRDNEPPELRAIRLEKKAQYERERKVQWTEEQKKEFYAKKYCRQKEHDATLPEEEQEARKQHVAERGRAYRATLPPRVMLRLMNNGDVGLGRRRRIR
ncbi:uncharacterized protein DNG_02664 [Cephalotrichum gorgonifer]|uniref:Uncharacterized protein n=1 Tax=Cephalotrichum gorgonifer TaxID=2041049 RepID=A0AAE8MTY4_9PEZI|nr:uncharacterized protein DNG_02664 [Cephalotrichum gorgonifer]